MNARAARKNGNAARQIITDSSGKMTANYRQEHTSDRLSRLAMHALEGLAAGSDVVFVATAAVLAVPFQELADSARNGAVRAGALRA